MLANWPRIYYIKYSIMYVTWDISIEKSKFKILEQTSQISVQFFCVIQQIHIGIFIRK